MSSAIIEKLKSFAFAAATDFPEETVSGVKFNFKAKKCCALNLKPALLEKRSLRTLNRVLQQIYNSTLLQCEFFTTSKLNSRSFRNRAEFALIG